MTNAAGIRLSAKLSSVACFVTLTLTAIAGCSNLWSQTYPGQIGVEAEDRPTGFVDAFKDQGRLFINSSGNPVPTDSNGWPTTDGIAVVFDDRPIPAWTGSIDDPAQYQPNCAGAYIVSFQGQATVSNATGNPPYPTLTFGTPSYNQPTNTTTLTVTMPGGATYADGQALMVINFTNTIRTYGGATNTGITNLQVIRPGFTLSQANSTQPFDPAFLNAFAPFAYLRFMSWLGTNTNPFIAGTGNTPLIAWAQRSLPTDAYQGMGPNVQPSSSPVPPTPLPGRAGAWGLSWEYVILLANATNKDIWINIPVNATGGSDSKDPTYVASPDTSSYVYSLAYLLKNGDAFTNNQGLNSGLHIYLEHSNEVWNSAFLQNGWNENAANAEVALGGSVLNNDGDTNSNDWAYRRDVKRLYEIAQIFQSVFGSGSLNTTIRPVYAWWQLQEGSGSAADSALSWFKNTYGPPSNYFYAMAQGDYFYASNPGSDSTIDAVLDDMQTSDSQSVQYVTANLATANKYALKLFTYEGGPDNGSGNLTNIGVEIEANRIYAANNGGLGIDTMVENHIRNNWFGQGGSMFGYFQLSGAYSRYGSYGLTDDYRNLATAKYSALLNLTGYTAGPPSAPTSLNADPGNAVVTLTWPAVTGAANYNVNRSLSSNGTYTTIATVSTSPYSDTTVTNGTTYYYEVTAMNSGGTSGPSPVANATPQSGYLNSAPLLSATAGNGQATLTWTSVSGATSYSIYEGTSPGGENPTPIETGISATAFTVPSLNNGTAYYFYVTGVDSLGAGPNSNEVSVNPVGPPPAPANLTATSGNGQALVSWNAATGATSYNIYDSTTSGGEGSTPVYTGITGTSYTVPGLTNGTRYYFKVAGVNSAGAGNQSAEATTIPAIPTGTLLAYEPFGEASGTPLSGATGNGDSGWGAAWIEQNGSAAIPGYEIVSTTPLTYTGLQTTGNYAIGGYAYQSAGRLLNVGSSGPFSSYLSGGLIGASGQTVWLSFLLREDANPSNGQINAIYITSEGSGSSWVPQTGIGVGYFGGAADWGLQLNNGTPVLSNVAVTQGQTTLMVVSVTFGATNVVNLYINPTSLGGSAPGTPSATLSTTSSVAFQSLAYLGGYGTNDSSLADIRFGTTYAIVTPSTGGQQSQTITFAPPASPVTYGVSPITLSATANSGLGVTFSVVSGPGSVSGNTLTVTGAGTIVVAANQAGNANYTAAPQVTQSVVVNQASQTITFTQPTSPITYPVSPITLSATANSGLAVIFSVVSGPGAVSGSTLTITGTGTVVVAANQAGNANYAAAAQVTHSIVVNSGSGGGNLLAYEPFGEAAGTALNGASGSGDSGWNAAWIEQTGSTANPGYDIVSAAPLTYTGLQTTGNYAIGGYGYQSAGRLLNAGSSGPFSSYLSGGLIGASGQTVWLSFLLREDANPSNGQINAVYITSEGSGSSWVPQTGIGVGYFGGAADWGLQFNNGTPVLSSVAVAQGQPTLLVVSVTFGATNVVNLYVNPTSLGGSAPGTPSATLSTTSSVAFQSLAYLGGYGTNDSSLADIRFGSTYAAVTPTTGGQQSQTISFTPPTSPVTYPVSPITLSATASSGLAVTFSVLSGPGTVSGNTLTVTGTGTIVVAANQAGNASYLAAPQVTQSVVVNSGSGGGTLLAYEPFGEAAGTPLNGASGGGDSGWSAAWIEQSGSTANPGFDVVSSNPMTYSGLQTTTNHAISGYQYQSAGRQLNLSTSGPFSSYLSGGMIGASGQAIWLSFLLRQDVSTSNGQPNAVYLSPDGGPNAWEMANLGIGYFGSSSNSGGNPYWSLQYNGITTLSNVQVAQGQSTLLVVEITFGATNQVNLYVNPTSLGGSAPATPNATHSTTNSLAFESLAYQGGYSTNESSLGDIRFGTTYAAVTP